MSIQAIQFFMMPDEFTLLVKHLATTLGLYTLLARPGRPPSVELVADVTTLAMCDGTRARWVFLTAEAPTPEQLSSATLRPAEWGWIDADVPELAGDTLYLVQMAAKSDWLDNGRVRENPVSLVTLRRVLPIVRAQLKRPVWAYNVQGGGAQPYNDLWYSEGAAQLVRSGGELKQRDVANVRFTLEASDIRSRSHPHPES